MWSSLLTDILAPAAYRVDNLGFCADHNLRLLMGT
jgi:hypothetical protein